MFTRRVIMSIKPGSATETRHILEGEVIPVLRRQKGMRHDDTFVSAELSEALLNSYWDTQEYSESYGRAAYPAALIALAGVLEGTPRVETFVISNSTFHRITARRREAHTASQMGRGGWALAPLKLRQSLGQEETVLISFKTGERRVGEVTVLDLGGQLRAGASREALHVRISLLIKEGRNQILLNLDKLSGIDAGGLGELLQSSVELNNDGGQLKLLLPSRALREMMSVTKLLNVFDIYDNEAEAVTAFSKPILDTEGDLLSYEYARYEKHY